MLQSIRRSVVTGLILTACLASGAAAQEDEQPIDARLTGFARPDGNTGKIKIEPARGGATSWFILGGLTIVAIGVMFKNGKRTHLD